MATAEIVLRVLFISLPGCDRESKPNPICGIVSIPFAGFFGGGESGLGTPAMRCQAAVLWKPSARRTWAGAVRRSHTEQLRASAIRSSVSMDGPESPSNSRPSVDTETSASRASARNRCVSEGSALYLTFILSRMFQAATYLSTPGLFGLFRPRDIAPIPLWFSSPDCAVYLIPTAGCINPVNGIRLRGMSETLQFVIQELEKRKGTWPTLAAESGVSKRTFEKIVNGDTRNPRIDTVEKLALYFREQAA